MIITDVHTHTSFSFDGRSDITQMLFAAQKKGIRYWGISEHFDCDYVADNILFCGKKVPFINADEYFSAARNLQKQSDKVNILVGGEFGFSRNRAAWKMCGDIIERYKPDFVVNSVHSQGSCDWYDASAFCGLTRREAFFNYLMLVKESLSVDYPYDIVGHIGYPSRFCPYEEKRFCYSEFSDILKDILTEIIERKKILEINTSTKGLDAPFLPFTDIVEAYYALGGREISLASDAHEAGELARGRENAVKLLKGIGFSHVTVPTSTGRITVPI